MDLERKKVVTTTRAGGGRVVAGSVWESRMRTDEVKGGIKVFNDDQTHQENAPSDQNNNNSNGEIQVYKRMRPKQSVLDSGLSGGKRKTWKSDNSERSPVQISKQRSEKEKTLDENGKELSVSLDGGGGIKKSPAQIKKTRSELVGMELSASVDGFERSPIHRMRTRAMWQMLSGEGTAERKNSLSLRKLKSEPSKTTGDGIEGNVGLRKAKSEKVKALDEENSVELRKGIEKSPNGIKESGSVESLDEFGVCEEKEITTNLSNVVADQVNYTSKVEETDEDDDWDEEMEEAVGEDKFETAIEKKSIVVKEMNVSGEKPISPVVIAEKKIQQRNERAAPISTIVRNYPPSVVNHPRIISNPTSTKPTSSVPEYDEPQKLSKTHSKLESLVDLVMWRDVSKSAFIFGLGTFSIISSSYTKDLNISFISVISYLGLVYLAAIFLFRSIIKRSVVETDDTDQDHVVGEEEAIWALKLILPYLNEFLLNVRALFSGDPATTMKLAVLLFVLARCGSSITIWKMAKLGFFGVFTVPKVCSSYSTQLTAFGTFWIRRFRDAWMSCTHKKGVAFAIFTVVWNLSSVVARIWAVFMLFVAFKYYQQSMVKEECSVQQEVEEEEATGTGGRGQQASWQGQVGGQRQGRPGPTFIQNSKTLKKKL